MKLNWNFPGGVGMQNKTLLWRGVLDIFRNCTIGRVQLKDGIFHYSLETLTCLRLNHFLMRTVHLVFMEGRQATKKTEKKIIRNQSKK